MNKILYPIHLSWGAYVDVAHKYNYVTYALVDENENVILYKYYCFV